MDKWIIPIVFLGVSGLLLILQKVQISKSKTKLVLAVLSALISVVSTGYNLINSKTEVNSENTNGNQAVVSNVDGDVTINQGTKPEKTEEELLPNVTYTDNVKVSYLSDGDERFNNIYPLFEDYVDNDREYKFSDNCATLLSVTNQYDEQIQLNKIIFSAKEIKVDYTPHLIFSAIENEKGLELIIDNNGWGSATNLKIKITSSNLNIEEYFPYDALNYTVPSVEAGESVRIPFIQNTDLIKYEEGMSVSCDVELECDCEGVPNVTSNISFWVYGGKLIVGQKGDGADKAYGIRINTEKDNFEWEENIVEYVDSGEILVMPICFFPDKSCSMKFKICFEIIHNGEKLMIESDEVESSFEVPSMSAYTYEYNCAVNDEGFINLNDSSKITFPYNNITQFEAE